MARFRVLNVAFVLSIATAMSWAGSDLRLIEAIKRRDAKAVDTLLKQGADVNATAPDGATPLSWAAFLDLNDVAERLIAGGAKANSAGEYGETPLTLAVANGNAQLAAKLIKAGADPKATRWNGETALMIAARAGNVDAVRMLLDLGLDVNGTEPKNLQSPLMWASAEGHSDVVDLLIKKGANVNAVSKAGFTPLTFAALKNDPASVKRLIEGGANPNHALGDQTKILTAAAAGRSYAAAIALLDGGADPNIVDRAGNTPLHLAAQAGSLELVRKLLAKSAEMNARNAKVTGGGGFRQVAGEHTPLLLAARSNHVEVMRALIEAGADIKLKSQDGAGLLLNAAASGRVDAAKYAFEFDKDLMAVDDTGRTVMHAVVSNGGGGATQDDMVQLVQYLADIGAPMDQTDGRGRTPIQAGDGIPLDKPIQRMADIIVSRGGTPKAFPKEYVPAAKSSEATGK